MLPVYQTIFTKPVLIPDLTAHTHTHTYTNTHTHTCIHLMLEKLEKFGYLLYFRVHKYPESLPKIDFAFYKSRIAMPGLVDSFEKSVSRSLWIDYCFPPFM